MAKYATEIQRALREQSRRKSIDTIQTFLSLLEKFLLVGIFLVCIRLALG